MKADIHPPYHTKITVTCACGNSFTTGSTQEKIAVEVCSNCHPFYTGKQKLVDATGRVDRFKKKLAETKHLKTAHVSPSKRKRSPKSKKAKTVKIG